MEYVFDTITRAPSQVFVKGASSIGEEAAKVLGGIIDESITNCADDVTATIKESTDKACETLKESVKHFSEAFKETGVDAFSEWGYAIERALVSLGERVETGLINAGNRLGGSIEGSLSDQLDNFSKKMKDAAEDASDKIGKFGLEHVVLFKSTYNRELFVICLSLLLMSSSVFLFALGYAFHSFHLIDGITYLLKNELKTLVCVFFGLLAGYFVYSWNVVHGRQSNVNNPMLLFVIVGVMGLLIGNIIRDATLGNSSLNFIIIISIVLFVSALMYRFIAWDIVSRVYSFWKSIKEFQEWKRGRNEKTE